MMRGSRRLVWWVSASLLALALVVAVPVAPARALPPPPILVDKAADSDVPAIPGNCPTMSAGTCTLRDAVAKSVAGDTINFAAGIATIHLAHNPSDVTYGGAIFISHDLTISATGANVAIEADAGTQLFAITDATVGSSGTPISAQVTLNNLTIQNFSLATFGLNGGAIISESTGTLTLTNMTFKNNSNVNGAFGGGAVFLNSHLRPPLLTTPLLSASLVVTNCIFDGNQAADDGGGAIEWNGPMTVTSSTFTNNISNTSDGGAILDSIEGSDRATASNGVVTVSDSTFTGNQSVSGSGGAISGNGIVATNVTFANNTIGGFGGGAVEVHNNNPPLGSPASSSFTNVTFTGNQSTASQAGAIEASGGPISLTNVTVSGNSAFYGGGINIDVGAVTVTNSIIAGNTDSIGAPDIAGPVTSLGFNLIGAADTSSGWIASDHTGTVASPLSPRLGALGTYGSADGTKTVPPLPGSPAINAGTATNAPTTDQRGKGRVGTVDIGAFESQGFTLTKTSGDLQTKAPGATFAPLVVTVAPVVAGEPVDGGLVTFTGPGSGADITVDPQTATIGATTTGQASITPVANATIGGPYTITAAASGTTPASVAFSLTNATVVLTPQTYVVTTVGDMPDNTSAACLAAGSGGCTLRQAVNASNANDPGAGNHNTITFAVGGTIILATDAAHGTLTLTKDVTIDGTGQAVAVDGGCMSGCGTTSVVGGVGVFAVNNGVTAGLTHLTIQHGNGSGGFGGGIINRGTLTVTNSILSGNAATGFGGGVYNEGALTVTGSTFSGSAAVKGGGIFNVSGTLMVTNSTFSGNTAGQGGGIYNGSGTMSVTDSTFFGNSALGGGIFTGVATLTVTSSTLSGNSDGLYNNSGSAVTVVNSIIAGNTPNGDTFGAVTGSPNLIGGVPLLAPLGNYGGPTQTMALLPGSPAIDAGSCAGGYHDQRGVAPVGAACDIGAFESQGFTLAKTSGDGQSRPVNTAFAPLVVTVAANAAGAPYLEPVNGGVVTFTGPGSGAGIATSPATATIGATTTGQASITPTANGTPGGPYPVAAAATGTTPASVPFMLANYLPATHLGVSGAPTAAAGQNYTLTVSALDATNAPVPLYIGTIAITSSDTFARLPAAHTFAAADNGVFVFTFAFNSNGSQTATATDLANGGLTASLPVAVTGPSIFSPVNVSGVNPTYGPIGGSTTITITGNGFLGASVAVGGACTNVQVNPAGTQITCTTPAHAAGTVDVVVTVGAATATANHAFTYIDPNAPAPPPPGRQQPGQPGNPVPVPTPVRPQPGAPGNPGPIPPGPRP